MRDVQMSDIKTGEDLGIMSIPEVKDIQRNREYSIKKQATDEFSIKIAEMYGGYYFLFYRLATSNIEKQHVIRFLYLCIYMDYENKLVYGNSTIDARRYMTNDDLQEILNLGKAVANKTKEALIRNGLMTIDEDNHMLINSEYCLKGKIVKEQFKAMKTRLFERAIKELYEKSYPREHRKLSLLVTLLPFINFYHNVLCYNSECQFDYQIIPINLKQLCKIVKYSENQIGRLKRDLLDLRVGGELVVMLAMTGNAEFIIINPRVYYRAGNVEILDSVSNKFLIKS